LSEPLSVKMPELVAVAVSKLVAVAVAAAAILNVPPLTALNEVAPAFRANEPETTFTIVLTPEPEIDRVAPFNEPPKLRLPETVTVPLVRPEAPVIDPLLKKFVVPLPLRLDAVTVPVVPLKVSVEAFASAPKLPLANVNDADPPVTFTALPPWSALLIVRSPLLTFNVPL
jgi:hypothetical protein